MGILLRMDIKESGVPIRVPATANLMIDSVDRTSGSPDNFLINKKQSILNGFFNRIGATELVLEWFLPNVYNNLATGTNYTTISVNVTGAPANPYQINFPTGSYTMENLLDTLVAEMTALALGSTFTIVQQPGGVFIHSNAATFAFAASPLQGLMGLPVGGANVNQFVGTRYPDLRPIRYLDFVSSKLTYNQELKDDSTDNQNRSVLARWYMAWDNPTQYDGYGFPILMGYTPFVLRRIYNPPKQIRWDPRQPVGQLDFQVYTDQGNLLSQVFQPNVVNVYFQWLMTLQASEN